MVILDTDILLLAYAFHRDPRRSVNTTFLGGIQQATPVITIYNLMEILGQMSFNLSPERLADWKLWLIDAYQLTVIWPVDPDEPMTSISFRAEMFEQPFERMSVHRSAFMDALILNMAERTPNVECFVTWNARHLKEKSSLPVFTPQEYLDRL